MNEAGRAPDAAAAPRASEAAAPRGLRLDSAPAAVLFFAFALIATAGVIGLFETTETRYAEIAREMVASGDWLKPHLNGISHFHKPPLAYWLTAASFATFGVSEWAARLPVAIATSLLFVFTALAARRRFASLGAEAPLAVWALGSAVIVLALGRALAADPFLAACVAAWWAFAPSPWAAVALGLGFLAKGPVVLVPTVAAVLVASIGPGGRDARRLLGPAWGWALFAAIALGWYLLLAANVPGLLGYWLGDQIVGRYASTRHARSGSPLYFVVVLIAGMLPWTPALVRGIGRAVSERARVEARLLLAWLLVPTLFLSFSGSKLPGYLLPAAPAAALLVAIGWRECGRVWRGVMALVLVAVAAAGWILGPRAFAGLVGLETPARVPLPFAAHAALFAIAYAATWVWRARLAPAAALFTTGVVLLIAAVSPFEARLGSPRPLARVLAENRQPGEPVVEYRHFAAGFPFYLRERVRLLEVPREVGFDTTERLAGMIVATDSLRVWTERGGRVWIVGPEAPAQELASSLGLQFAPIARTPRTSVGYVSR